MILSQIRMKILKMKILKMIIITMEHFCRCRMRRVNRVDPKLHEYSCQTIHWTVGPKLDPNFQKISLCTEIDTYTYVDNFWEGTSVPEMNAYFGLVIILGLRNQPWFRNFWVKDPFLENLAVQWIFSLKCYSKLSEYLHVSDSYRYMTTLIDDKLSIFHHFWPDLKVQ